MSLALWLGCVVAGPMQQDRQSPAQAITFHQHVLPILQKRCHSCHTPGEIGPMPLVSYKDVRPWAAAIRESTKLRTMPPWFADPSHGAFANDPRLSDDEIRLIDLWSRSGAPEGNPRDGRHAPVALTGARFSPDLVMTVPAPIHIPANAAIDYQYVILPLPFTFDRWVRAVEIRPSDRSVVHHAVLYVREAGSLWLRNVPPGVPYAPARDESEAAARSRDTKEDILGIYTPGAPATAYPDGMAKKVSARSDLVLQIHCTSKKSSAVDQPQVGLCSSAIKSKGVS